MKECFECGATKDIQEHHVVPRLRGGTKTVPLCYSCHCKSHGRDSKGLDHSRLVSEGIKKKIAEKGHWGNTKGVGLSKAVAANKSKADAFAAKVGGMMSMLSAQGQSNKGIARLFNSMEVKTPSGRGQWTGVSVSRVLKRYKKIKKDDK